MTENAAHAGMTAIPVSSKQKLPRAVIFDMDNTLHDLRRARHCAADALMAYCGVFGDLHIYSLNKNPPTLIEDAVALYMADGVDADFEQCTWLYHTLELACISPFEGIEELLSELKSEGVHLAVISNADREDMEKRMKYLGYEQYFDLIVTPETFGVKKPDPRVYQKTLEALGVLPEETVMIGDKKDRDVRPPRELGIKGVHATFGSVDKRDKICAVDSPEEFLALLKKG